MSIQVPAKTSVKENIQSIIFSQLEGKIIISILKSTFWLLNLSLCQEGIEGAKA
jgi:hypothetical protein